MYWNEVIAVKIAMRQCGAPTVALPSNELWPCGSTVHETPKLVKCP